MIQGVAGDLPPGDRTPGRPRLRPGPASAPAGGPTWAGPTGRRADVPARVLLGVLGAGLLLVLLTLVVPELGGSPQDRVAQVTVHLATAALLLRAAVHERRSRRPSTGVLAAWCLLALASGCLAAGQPAGYVPAAAVALALLVRERVRRRRPAQWWDAATVAVAAAAAGAALVEVAGGALPWAGGAAAALLEGRSGLPPALGTAWLLALVLAGAVLGGPRTGPSLRWLAGGLLLMAAAAAFLAGTTPAPGREAGLAGFVGLAGLAGALLVGVSTLQPAGRPPAEGPARRSSDRPGARPVSGLHPRPPAQVLRTVTPFVALLLVAACLAGLPVDRGAAVLGLVAVAGALTRMVLFAPESEELSAADGARTDPLTGLASRKAISEILAGDPGTSWAPDGSAGNGLSGWTDRVALLLLDIDRFEDINVALGREAGDEVLTEVGARLRAVLRPEQLLARLGGDEFAVLLPGAGREPATRVAQTLRDALTDPLEVNGTRLHVQATVGVATCLLPRGEPEDLLRQADLAVSRAKAGGTGVEVYDEAVDRHGPQRLRRIDELRSALEHGDLEVYLQPQVELMSGRIVGAEALARWRHPHDGVLLPAAFLPLAAQTGLLRPVATAVLESALTACAQWWRRGHEVPVSVNLSADDLRDGDLTERFTTELARHGLPSSALRIELTEDVLVTDPPTVAALLRRWRAAGVAVALDDYGTGFSSLAHLRELPLDELKLDRVFVADVRRRSTATIILHTIAMAHGLGMRVVAEGVEDETTARTLAAAGCDVGQGLHFGPAMAPPVFLAHLDRSR